MLEAIVTSAAGMLLIAASTYRLRADAGVPAGRAGLVRWSGAALLALAFVRCGTMLDGERIVRCVVAASLSAVVLVLALSAWPRRVLAPVRWAMRATKVL